MRADSVNLIQQMGNETLDEERLITLAKEKPERFKPLYEKYYAQILKFVYQRVTTKEDARDITQQVFIQAMIALPKYESRGLPFSSWLYRIAVNEMNQAFRKNQKQRGINLNTEYLQNIAYEIAETKDDEISRILLDVLTELEENEFQLVEMRFFEQRPFKEIGEILNITEANAKMRLYRILEKLKPMLEQKLKY